jgi:hypothetical protein
MAKAVCTYASSTLTGKNCDLFLAFGTVEVPHPREVIAVEVVPLPHIYQEIKTGEGLISM